MAYDTVSQAHNEGRAAALRGLHVGACPYPYGLPEERRARYAWQKGHSQELRALSRCHRGAKRVFIQVLGRS